MAISGLKKASFHIQGLCPTIMNNGRKANPMDEFSKARKKITDKKPPRGNLSDEDFEELCRLDFMGALYVDESAHPCWPADNVEAMILAAAKKCKKGPEVKVGIMVDGNSPLIYDGPKDADELWKDKRFVFDRMVRQSKAMVLRVRPIFSQWELRFNVLFDSSIVNPGNLAEWIEIAGARIGLSDWRPKYGRFEVL